MQTLSYPYILSPSLGYPQLTSLQDNYLEVIVATLDSDVDGKWKLISSSSYQNSFKNEIELRLRPDDTIELLNINYCHSYKSLDEIRSRFSRHMLSRILDSQAKLLKLTFEFNLPLKQNEKMVLRNNDGMFLPTLYDLVFSNNTLHQIKPHCVCLRKDENKDLRFMHLTDLHLSRRNDLIQQEISTMTGKVKGFNNFNQNLRDTIVEINHRFSTGLLDFVVISGDLVDFVYHGIQNRPNSDTNWRLFLEIMTGAGLESSLNNYGVQGPIFTSLGNHDRRLYPYDVKLQSIAYGLTKNDADKFDFKYFSDMQSYNQKILDTYQKLIRNGRSFIKDNVYFTITKMIPFEPLSKVLSLISPMIALLRMVIRKLIKHLVEYGVIPIEARTTALNDYFLNINPFFNFVFSYSGHYFLLLDTGPDCLTAQTLWDEGDEKLHRIDMRELIGGSPDSMAFYPANENYDIGQITWMENVLALIQNTKMKNSRIMVIVHAPPINTEAQPRMVKPTDEVLLEKGKVNTRFGTINHFVSQFLHLCRGKMENNNEYSGPIVDLILSGHSHYTREYRIGDDNKIYSSNYSKYAVGEKFEEYKPIVLQTAACGPYEKSFQKSPYHRIIHITKQGDIQEYKQYPE